MGETAASSIILRARKPGSLFVWQSEYTDGQMGALADNK